MRISLCFEIRTLESIDEKWENKIIVNSSLFSLDDKLIWKNLSQSKKYDAVISCLSWDKMQDF